MDDIAASIAKVDRMLDRVVKVIGRERPEKVLRPDISYPRVRAKPVPKYMPTPVSPGPRGSGYSFSPDVDAAFDRVDEAERELREYARTRGQRVARDATMSEVDRAFEECSNAR